MLLLLPKSGFPAIKNFVFSSPEKISTNFRYSLIPFSTNNLPTKIIFTGLFNSCFILIFFVLRPLPSSKVVLFLKFEYVKNCSIFELF